MRHLFSLLLAFVLIGGLSTIAYALPDACIAADEDCSITGVYLPTQDRTVWTAVCGEFEIGGYVGGNQIPGICGF